MRVNINGVNIDCLDLGCGKNKKGVGIDIEDFGQEIVWDLTKGIPLPNNSVHSIVSSHFLEHITVPQINDLVREMIRVCADGATIEARVPHADRDEAMFLTHYTLWNEQRARGIPLGYAYAGENTLSLLEVKRENPLELYFKWKVTK
jgi:predicted SAM-dependent methyltransferase